MEESVKLEIANENDALNIANLLNIAYRGGKGWTTEKTLVSGNRCTTEDIESEIKSKIIIYLVHRLNGVIQACISLQKNEDNAYIGSFSVLPDLQNNGLGNMVLKQAEEFAKVKLGAKRYTMVVLSNRDELISYYERRGYQRSGNISGYPTHLNVGRPINSDQTIEELIKYA